MAKKIDAEAAAAAAAAAAQAAEKATEEILVDFLEDEIVEADKAVIRNELKSSIKLRRALEGLAATRFEIANAELDKANSDASRSDFVRLHKKIMTQIERAAAAREMFKNI